MKLVLSSLKTELPHQMVPEILFLLGVPVEPERRRQGRPNRDSVLRSGLHKVGMEELSLLDLCIFSLIVSGKDLISKH